MIFRSTPDSIRNTDLSVLAVIETIVASSISIFIGFWAGTFEHMAIAALIAPFLLLQSERSAIYFHRMVLSFINVDLRSRTFGTIRDRRLLQRLASSPGRFQRSREKLEKVIRFTMKGVPRGFLPLESRADSGNLATFPYRVIGPALSLWVFRIVALLRTILEHPIYTLRQIPSNWRIAVLSLDSFTPPEIVPQVTGDDRRQQPRLSVADVASFISRRVEDTIKTDRGYRRIKNVLSEGPRSLILLSAFIPSLAYRWSIKSTALLWSPLLWILFVAEQEVATGQQLRVICETAWYKVSRIYSIIVILMFVIKWITLSNILVFREQLIQYIPIQVSESAVVENYVAPSFIPRWQAVAALNALLMWILYFVADWVWKRGEPYPETQVIVFIKGMSIIRFLLSSYTIFCTLYISIFISKPWPLAPLGDRWFPG